MLLLKRELLEFKMTVTQKINHNQNEEVLLDQIFLKTIQKF